jgi:hypothetical protein
MKIFFGWSEAIIGWSEAINLLYSGQTLFYLVLVKLYLVLVLRIPWCKKVGKKSSKSRQKSTNDKIFKL